MHFTHSSLLINGENLGIREHMHEIKYFCHVGRKMMKSIYPIIQLPSSGVTIFVNKSVIESESHHKNTLLCLVVSQTEWLWNETGQENMSNMY
jgi:hypothetical protein